MKSRYPSTIFASCFMQFVATLSMTFVNAFLTLFIYYDIGVSSLGQAALWSGLSTFVAGSCLALTSPLWGWMTDRYGPKWMMVRVLATHSILTGLVAFAGNVQTVLLLRGLRGLMGGTSIVAITAIASASRRENLPGALGYQHTAQLLGSMIGPIFGGLAAPIVGFRACFLISGVLIACAIPLTLILDWPKGQGKKATKPSFSGLAGMEKMLTAMFLVRVSVNFLSPILPVYLRSSGVRDEQLTAYTGVVITLTKLAFAGSIPITSRKLERRRIPTLFGLQSLSVLGQGAVISLPSLLALRTAQMVLHSPAQAHLFSAASETREDKGVAIGMMSSAKFFGGAISPAISSTANYLVGLGFSFGCMSLLSLAAAWATWRLLRAEGRRKGTPEGYLDQVEAE